MWTGIYERYALRHVYVDRLPFMLLSMLLGVLCMYISTSVLASDAAVCKAVEKKLGGQCKAGAYWYCTDLGSVYMVGDPCKKDVKKARKFFQLGCDGGDEGTVGHLLSCYLLGLMQKNGTGGKKALSAALSTFRLACEEGSPSSCFELGKMLYDGSGTKKDLDGARSSYQQACDGGSTEGCYQHAEMLSAGEGGPLDEEEAMKSYKAACEGSYVDIATSEDEPGLFKGRNPVACFKLAEYIYESDDSAKGEKTAQSYYQRAFDYFMNEPNDAGVSGSDYYFMIGCLFDDQHQSGTIKDHDLSQKYYLKSCEAGSATGCYSYAAKLDGKAKRKYLKMSCYAGDALGCSELASMWLEGVGGNSSEKEYQKYQNLACDLDSFLCTDEQILAKYTCDESADCIELGLTLAEGTGVEVDTRAAAAVFSKACDLGAQDACIYAASLYYKGDSGEVDYKKAKQYFKKGCDLNGSESCVGEHSKKSCSKETYTEHAPLACFQYAEMIREGKGAEYTIEEIAKLKASMIMGGTQKYYTVFDKIEAKQYLKASCEAEYWKACLVMVEVADSAGTEERKLLGIACQKNYYEACVALGWMWQKGEGGPKDSAAALKLFDKACEGGFKEGCTAGWTVKNP